MLRTKLFFSLLLSLYLYDMQAQGCYINLGDYSGVMVSVPSYLQDAACDLRNAFPVSLQEDFAVYDMGFYTEAEPMEGSQAYETNIARAKTQIAHDYYLLFSRISTPDKLYSRLKVEFLFPVGMDTFDCLIEDDIRNFQLFLPAFLQGEYQSLGGLPSNADLAMKNTILRFKEFVIEKKGCCQPGVTFSCSQCLEDDEIALTLTNKDFVEIKVDEWACFEKNGCLIYKLHDKTYNLKNILNTHKSYLENYFSPINVYYTYKLDNGQCFSDLPLVMKDYSNIDYFSIRIYADQRARKFFISSRYGIFKRAGNPKVHLINDNSGINVNEFKDRFNHFLNLMNCSGCANFNVTSSQALLLNQIGDNDLFIIVGNSPFVKSNLSQSLCKFASSKEFLNQVTSKLSIDAIELGDGLSHPGITGRMVVVAFEKMVPESFKASSKDEAAAFVSIHGFGHCVSGTHKTLIIPGAYLSRGERLYKFFNSDNIYECGDADFNNVSDLFNPANYKKCNMFERGDSDLKDSDWLQYLNFQICNLLGL